MISREAEYRVAEHLRFHRRAIQKLIKGSKVRRLPYRTAPHADLAVMAPGASGELLVECKTETSKGGDVGPELLTNLKVSECFGGVQPGKVYKPGTAEHTALLKRARAERDWTREFGHALSNAGIAAAYFPVSDARMISYARVTGEDFRRYYLLDQTELSALLFDGEKPVADTLAVYTSRANEGRWYCAGFKIPPTLLSPNGSLGGAVIAAVDIPLAAWVEECNWIWRAKQRLGLVA